MIQDRKEHCKLGWETRKNEVKEHRKESEIISK